MTKKRRVCILGSGNSAFELAQNVYKVAERVVLYGRHAPRLSSVARYTGDVRIKYLQVYFALTCITLFASFSVCLTPAAPIPSISGCTIALFRSAIL